jgi:hypothetical protein
MLGQRVGAVSNQEQQLKLLSLIKNASLEFCKVLYMFYNTKVGHSCSSPSVGKGEF